MDFFFPDYVILAVAVGSAVLGLFIGFSGALAFLAGLVVAGIVARVGWAYSADFLDARWARGLATLVVTLLGFGIVRVIVRKFVHCLLAQPADAILGSLTAFISGAAVSLAIAWLLTHFGVLSFDSRLLGEVTSLVG